LSGVGEEVACRDRLGDRGGVRWRSLSGWGEVEGGWVELLGLL
jgi:hypothetical protein